MAASTGGPERVTPAVDARFERSARRWLRAYPRRWRIARSDEVLGTLVDLAAPGATRLDLRSGVGLLVGGLTTRVRTGPPLHQRIGYLFGARVAPRCRAWVADDLARPVPAARLAVRLGFVPLNLPWAVPLLWRPGGWVSFAALVGLVPTALVLPARKLVRDYGLRHLVPGPGDPDEPEGWVEGRVPRERLTARSWIPVLTTATAWVTAVAVVVGFVSPPPVQMHLGVAVPSALLVGLLGAVLAARRWRARLRTSPAQPDRLLVVAGRRHVAAAVALAGYATVLLVSGESPAAYVAIALAVAGPLLMPALFAAWLRARAAPDDLAAIDLARVAATGRPPAKDRRVPAAVPAGSAEAGVSLVDLVHIRPDRPALGGG